MVGVAGVVLLGTCVVPGLWGWQPSFISTHKNTSSSPDSLGKRAAQPSPSHIVLTMMHPHKHKHTRRQSGCFAEHFC
jgi:hypothetical protein